MSSSKAARTRAAPSASAAAPAVQAAPDRPTVIRALPQRPMSQLAGQQAAGDAPLPAPDEMVDVQLIIIHSVTVNAPIYEVKLAKRDVVRLLAAETFWIKLPPSVFSGESAHPYGESRWLSSAAIYEIHIYGTWDPTA